MNDPRVEAAAAAMRDPKPNQIRYGEDLEEWVDRVMSDALKAADRADREQGIHRVRMDDATCHMVGEVLWCRESDVLERQTFPFAEAPTRMHYLAAARAVLAALTGAES